MKKIYYLAAALVLAVGIKLYAESVSSQAITPATTGVLTAATNTTAGTAYYIDPPQTAVRLYLTATGAAGTTNGSLIVKFSTATGGPAESVTNSFDQAEQSLVKLTITGSASTTNSITVSDWFVVSGVKYLRPGQIENTSNGTWTNIAIRVSYIP